MADDDGVVQVRNSQGALVSTETRKINQPKKVALDEDEFTDTIQHIIRRDFFPHVPKLKAKLEHLKSSAGSSTVDLNEVSARYASQQPTPSSTAQQEDEEYELLGKRTAPQPDEIEDKKVKKEDMRLDSFLSKYHSEDDASFNELVEKDQQKHREKYSWLYNKEKEQNLESNEQQQLAITDSENTSSTMKAIEYRPAGVKTWSYTAKNSLMYIPEGMEISVQEALQGSSKPREIVHENTRLSKEFLTKTQKSFSGVSNISKKDAVPEKVGVDGLVVNSSDAPNVNGYGFVATPDIRPGVDMSPLMTWGSIEDTPLKVDEVMATPGPQFKLPKISRREEIGMKLSEKASKANSEKRKAALQHATSSILRSSPALRSKLGSTPSNSERLQLLSPAAKKLMAKTGTPIMTGSHSIRSSYTPSPSPQTVATPRNKSLKSQTTTPLHTATTPNISLTDDLLNLKK
ncbi:splicing factor ESS-2 homolog [Dysidea avara]|uniref:splicing factor ESS-2 homolog n=1 Tax=Dysidea avara TaxID=196820 RepID=UPI00332FA9EE